ncbi:MAG: PucR family transcriptional regulator [Solirubrobacteraceae bacterium]
MDLDALDAITDAVESGAGLPEVIRAAARVLDASVAVLDRDGHTLAVAARSPADERSLLGDARDVEVVDLRMADAPVGRLHLRMRSDHSGALLRLVATLIAGEVARVQAPGRASEAAAEMFVRAVLDRELVDRELLVGRGSAIGMADVARGGSIIVAHIRPQVPAEEGWRGRVRQVAERGARGTVPAAVALLSQRDTVAGAEVVVLLAGTEEPTAARAAEGVLRELQASLPGFAYALGRSRVAADPLDLPRAADEARLAANVADGDAERLVLAFEETGAYRLLLSAMSENPAELQRFFAETVEPLVVYDEQYETDLVSTVEAFLEADGNVAGTAQRLFTHRHTVRYRLERVRELSGLDVGSSDGREKLSLGLKAMRVLGIASTHGPASEAGTSAGRVPARGGAKLP